MTSRLRVAVCADYQEEQWPSMDRVADCLLDELSRNHADRIVATPVRPAFTRRASRLWGGRTALNLDRGLNRLVDYPRHLNALAGKYDVFHVVDHSYSQLLHRVPSGRAVVTCHDLDTFRSVLEPDCESRSRAFRAMTKHIMAGFRRAAYVTCDTTAVRDELVRCGLVGAERVVVAHVGTGPEYSSGPDPERDRAAARLIGGPDDAEIVLHVGSTVARKRIDLVLQICADLRRSLPAIRLVRVGGPFTAEQTRLARELGIDDAVSVLPRLDDRTLAAVYRRAALLVLPSEREGFGLPLIEAMACGTPAVAGDLPTLREIGGDQVEFCETASGQAREVWTRRIEALLAERATQPDRWTTRRNGGIAQARQYTWRRFADRLAEIYGQMGHA